MNDTELFQLALGLVPPWKVASSSFTPSEKRLELGIEVPAGSKLPCPICGKASQIYDREEKRWRHLDFFQHQAYLVAQVPRVFCETDGVHQVIVPWARPGSGFTLLFEGLILAMAPHMAVKHIARLVGEHDTRIWRIIRHHVRESRARADHSKVKRMAFDETAARRNHDYVTISVDLDQHRVLFACRGKDSSCIGSAVSDLRAHGGDPLAVTDVACDLSAAFTKGISEFLPKARITYDRFHVTKLIIDALQETRREEQGEGSWKEALLKGNHWALVRNPENQTNEQAKAAAVIAMPMLHLRTGRAYRLKLAFQEAYARGPKHLKRWCHWAARCRLPAMVRAAKTIKSHWDGIVRWFESDITSAIMEGFNSLFQAAKSRARGYRNHEYFIDMIYLIGAKLDFRLTLVSHTK
ncbi:MAG: ISL3 family transposase [Chthoniobacterales bacterium]|nr:ISL3 family transposase [Chthoniobacterales bacterium]